MMGNVKKQKECFHGVINRRKTTLKSKAKNSDSEIFTGDVDAHFWSIKTGQVKVLPAWERIGELVARRHRTTEGFEKAFSALEAGLVRLQAETGLDDDSDFLLAVKLILGKCSKERTAA